MIVYFTEREKRIFRLYSEKLKPLEEAHRKALESKFNDWIAAGEPDSGKQELEDLHVQFWRECGPTLLQEQRFLIRASEKKGLDMTWYRLKYFGEKNVDYYKKATQQIRSSGDKISLNRILYYDKKI